MQAQYSIPDAYANLGELSSQSPVENPREQTLYTHHTLEAQRQTEQLYRASEGGGAAAGQDGTGCLRGLARAMYNALSSLLTRMRRALRGRAESPSSDH